MKCNVFKAAGKIGIKTNQPSDRPIINVSVLKQGEKEETHAQGERSKRSKGRKEQEEQRKKGTRGARGERSKGSQVRKEHEEPSEKGA